MGGVARVAATVVETLGFGKAALGAGGGDRHRGASQLRHEPLALLGRQRPGPPIPMQDKRVTSLPSSTSPYRCMRGSRRGSGDAGGHGVQPVLRRLLHRKAAEQTASADRELVNAECTGFGGDERPGRAPNATGWRSAPNRRQSLREGRQKTCGGRHAPVQRPSRKRPRTLPQAWLRRRIRGPAGILLHHANVPPGVGARFGAAPTPPTLGAPGTTALVKPWPPDLLRQAA